MVAREEDARPRREEQIDGRSGKPDFGQAEVDALFGRTRTELTNLFGSLRRIAFVEWQGIRLRAVDAAFRGAFFVCAFFFLLAASISASLMLVRGLRLALEAWSGAAWLGNLAGGAIVIGLLAAGAIAAHRKVRRNIVRTAEARLGLASRPASEAKA